VAARLIKNENSKPWMRWMRISVIALVLLSHFAWSGAHLFHFLGPVKTYFLGWDNGIDYLLSPRTEVRSLTDEEPTPILFGGRSSLRDAGAQVDNAEHHFNRHQVSMIHALMARAWFFMYFVLLSIAAARTMRERIVWSLALVLLYFVSCGSAAFWFRSAPAFFKVDQGTPLKVGQTLHYELALGPQMLAALRRQLDSGDEVVVFLRGPNESDKFKVAIYVGNEKLPFNYQDIGAYVIDDRVQLLSALSRSDKLSVEITNTMNHDSYLHGWQRGGLSRRTCQYTIDSQQLASPAVLPVVEVRLRRPNGRVTLAGF